MRQRQYLVQRYRAMAGYIGQILIIVGILQLVPIGLVPFFPHEIGLTSGFLLAGLPLIVLGVLAWALLVPKEPATLTVQEGMLVIVVVWLVSLTASAIPFMTANGLNFNQAFFESTSGWTGTGLTVVDVTNSSRLILFHRGFTQLAGGAGIAIIVLSAVAGSIGTGLGIAEGRTDQLAPHVRRSATIVLSLYAVYTIAGVIALRLAGMGWFDATKHAFTAIGTGGFSTRPNSIGYWDNPLIEVILIILMLLGGTNFFIAYTFVRGRFSQALRSGELRLMAVLVISASVLLFLLVTSVLYTNAGYAARVAVFESVSAITTSGLSKVDYRTWPDFGWLVLMVLMLIGGGIGSTSGGLKLIRVYILYKAVNWEIRRAFMPPHMVNEPAIWTGDRRELLSDRQVRQTALFTGVYLTVFLAGTAVFVANGYPLRESMFEFASTLATTGMSSGVTTPDMPPHLLWAMSAGMLLGRLEFFAVIVAAFKVSADLRTMLKRLTE